MPGVLHNAFIHQKRGDQGVESQLRETFIGDELRVLRRLLPPRWRHPAEDRDDAESNPEVWHVQDSPTWVGGIDTGITIEDNHFFLTYFLLRAGAAPSLLVSLPWQTDARKVEECCNQEDFSRPGSCGPFLRYYIHLRSWAVRRKFPKYENSIVNLI